MNIQKTYINILDENTDDPESPYWEVEGVFQGVEFSGTYFRCDIHPKNNLGDIQYNMGEDWDWETWEDEHRKEFIEFFEEEIPTV